MRPRFRLRVLLLIHIKCPNPSSDLVEFGFGEFFFGIVDRRLRGIGHVILLGFRLAGFGKQSVKRRQRGNATRNWLRETAPKRSRFGPELRRRGRGIAGWQFLELGPRLDRTYGVRCRLRDLPGLRVRL